MKAIFLATALVSTFSFAETVQLPKVRIPSVTLEHGAAVKFIMLTPNCVAKASFLDQLNNGMDAWTTCADRTSTLRDNVANGHVIKANADGSFDLPALKETYSTRKSAIFCVTIQGVDALTTIYSGEQYADVSRAEALNYCSKAGQFPEWTPPGDRGVTALALKNYVTDLSKPVVLKAN